MTARIEVSLEPAHIAVTAIGPGGRATFQEFGHVRDLEDLDLRTAAEEANSYAREVGVALGIEVRLLPVVAPG